MIVFTPPLTDLFETKAGIERLPCVCGPDASCLWHWGKEAKNKFSKNDKKKQEEFYARPENNSGGSAGRKQQSGNVDLRADGRGPGKRSGKDVPKSGKHW